MPPTDRFVISFAAEPPQEPLPVRPLGRHARRPLPRRVARDRHRGRGHRRDRQRDRVVPGPHLRRAHVHPRGGADDRRLRAVRVRVVHARASRDRASSTASADFTAELAESNPDWKLDLNDDVIGTWRGEQGNTADMTLVWGVPLVPGGAVVTAELARTSRSTRCELVEDRFTLIAPDNYRVGLPRDQAVEQARRRARPRVALRRGRGRGRASRTARGATGWRRVTTGR